MAVVQVEENVMCLTKIGKVVLNIGVGKSGESLEKAKKVISDIVSRTPSVRKARQSIRDFGVHLGDPIGLAVTLRGEKAIELVKLLLAAKEMKIPEKSFDEGGNCSFGIKEHIDIPGVKYDPDIGIFGMDVSVVLERPGYRVARRRRASSRIGRKHRVNREEAIRFFKEALNVDVT